MAKALTFGERAVGLTFNPSDDPSVTKIKQLFADAIDELQRLRTECIAYSNALEVNRMYSLAITEAQSAQMWAVKAATWNAVDS